VTPPVALAGLSLARHRLDNGATIVAQQTSTHPAVTLYATVDAGSGLDPDRALGLSHFVARVIDRGTESRSADELSEALDERGVSLSAEVTRHLLVLSCTCLAEDVEAVLDLLADVIRRPTFPPDQLERRRSAIITVLGQDRDNPAIVAGEALMALLYPHGHPYGRPARGTPSSVGALGRDDLVRFHRAHVGPASLRVIVAGDVDPSRAIGLAERAFGDWESAGGARLEPPPAPLAVTRSATRKTVAGKPQADIAYGFTTIARHDPRYYAMMLMNNVLGQYAMGGRLGDSIRERQGMAYYVFSSFEANVAEGPLVVRAGVNPANVDRTIASIDEEVGRLGRAGVTEAELADSRRYLVGSLPRVLETNAGIAAFLQTAEYFGLGLDFDRRLPDLLNAVTLDEVNDVARTFLAPERAAVAVAGP
jgi:zinc protease